MNKKHIISLAGDLASGKGETSKILTEKLGYGIYRNGQYFRELAKKMNMSVTEFNIYVEKHTLKNVITGEQHDKNHDITPGKYHERST